MKTSSIHLTALFASVLITALSVATLAAQPAYRPVSQINGIRVIDLAPIVVRPDPRDVRTAAVLTDGNIASAMVVPALGNRTASAASLLGAQMAMPYYAFGKKSGHVAKE